MFELIKAIVAFLIAFIIILAKLICFVWVLLVLIKIAKAIVAFAINAIIK